MAQWADVPWNDRMYASADEAILTKAVAAIENAYENEAGGMSRFPGLRSFCTFGGNRTYLSSFRNNLIAATDQGKLYRISQGATVEDVTGVPISGGQRVIFTQTEDQLVLAAGGPILQLLGDKTQQLSTQAPESTHVAFLDGYLLAIEPYSGRFNYCDPGQYETWNPLSVFSANGKPDDLNSMTVSPFRELLLGGVDSIEQYESLPNGNQPFTRRWTTGEGVFAPYTLIADKTGTYGINSRFEFVRFFGQISIEQSADVDLVFQNVDDWTDAWAAECGLKGQKFFLMQMPNATNVHGTKGITLLLDYRNRKWSFLYGWDDKVKVPTRWPGWSVQRLWGQMYIGVPGGVAVLDDKDYQLLGGVYPYLIRSAHISKWGPSRIDDVRIRLRRGDGQYGAKIEPRIGLRVNRDNLGFDQWTYEDMGAPGQRDMTVRFGGQGYADSWQFEIQVTDNVPVEFVSMQAYVERAGW